MLGLLGLVTETDEILTKPNSMLNTIMKYFLTMDCPKAIKLKILHLGLKLY